VTPADVLTLCALCLLNASAALWALLRTRGTTDMRRVGIAAGTVLALTTLEILLLYGRVLTRGGAMHLVWLDLVLVVPFAGIGILVAAREGRAVSPGARRAAWLSFAMIPLAVYAQFIAPYEVVLEQATVRLPAERAGESPLIVGVLSDMQMARVSEHERTAVRRLMDHVPDIILLPGDIFEGSPKAFRAALPDIQQLLSLLSAPGGVWIVPGDSDVFASFDLVTLGTNARVLRDEIVDIRIRDRHVRLLGAEQSGEPERVLPEFESLPGDDDIRLVLVHRPRNVTWLEPDSRVDLVIAGHTHGGQVAFPFVGPVFVGSPLSYEVAAGGLHEVEGRQLYVSRGLGMERHQSPQIRFLSPPEITLLTLR
jgi:predicted MPP superfamily phosphohydrolase